MKLRADQDQERVAELNLEPQTFLKFDSYKKSLGSHRFADHNKQHIVERHVTMSLSFWFSFWG